MLKSHKTYRERFTLMYFLTGNGLQPQVATDWILAGTATPFGRNQWTLMREATYDAKAVQHMKDMQKQIEKGTFFSGNKKMMDMIEGKTKMF